MSENQDYSPIQASPSEGTEGQNSSAVPSHEQPIYAASSSDIPMNCDIELVNDSVVYSVNDVQSVDVKSYSLPGAQKQKIFTNKKRNLKPNTTVGHSAFPHTSSKPTYDDISQLNNGSAKLFNNLQRPEFFPLPHLSNMLPYGHPSHKPEVSSPLSKSGSDVQFRCDMCGKCFTHNCKLQSHQKYHSGEKPFKCEDCGKYFSQRAGLAQHQRLHTGEKPFKCQECGKAFAQLAGVVQHQRTHSGEKPYSCTECGKAFSQRAGLIQHERLHTGEKPFSCLECGKCFTQLAGLNQHMRTHSGEKPFKCHICGKCYTQHAGLITHMKSHEDTVSPSYSEEIQLNTSSDGSEISSPSQEESSHQVYSAQIFSHNLQKIHNGNPQQTTSQSAFVPQFSPPVSTPSTTHEVYTHSTKGKRRPRMEKPFKCQICSKAYTQFAGLMIHQASHQPEQGSLSNSINAAVENILTGPIVDQLYPLTNNQS